MGTQHAFNDVHTACLAANSGVLVFLPACCCPGSGDAAEGPDQDEEDIFQPSKGNVAFGSASDGWAFRLDQFAEMYSAKLGAKPAALAAALWGDWAYLPKEKRVVRARARGGQGRRTMFVTFALDPIWRAYSVCEGEDIKVGCLHAHGRVSLGGGCWSCMHDYEACHGWRVGKATSNQWAANLCTAAYRHGAVMNFLSTTGGLVCTAFMW